MSQQTIDRSKFDSDTTTTHWLGNAVDVFHLYGRRAILELYVRKDDSTFQRVESSDLKGWVHDLNPEKVFDRFEVFAVINSYRANLSREDAERAHRSYLEKKDRNARQRSGFHQDEEDDLLIPGPLRGLLND